MSTAIRGGVDNIILISGSSGNDPQVLAGTVDPSAAAGVAAKEGSMYMRYGAGAGEFWLKTGAADTAWVNLTVAGENFLGYFGDASDGDLTLVGDDSIYGWYNDIDTAGFDLFITRLFVRGTLTIRAGSHVNSNGVDATSDAGALAMTASILGTGRSGGDGGDAGNGWTGQPGVATADFGRGGDGGAGGAGDSAAGAGGNNTISALETVPRQLPEIVTGRVAGAAAGSGYERIAGGAGGGGGGGSDTPDEGGGGGGGGNVMVIAARHIVIEAGGFIETNGGAGFAGTAVDAGGGGGGGGGVVLLCYETLVNAGTIQALGGVAGASGGGTGNAGTVGSVGEAYQLATI